MKHAIKAILLLVILVGIVVFLVNRVRPQVALHNGVIHLFYIQGEVHLKEFSPGLTKLNLGPWPIYYTQRPFPD
jgi:hypothetical protein